MSLYDQLLIIIQDLRSVLMWTCLMALGLIASWCVSSFLVKRVTPIISWMRSHGLQALWIAPFVMCMVYVGSTKNGSVTFPYTDVEQRYLIDAGSYVTNDYVHVSFTRSALVPNTADFLGAVRPAGNTNDEDWVIFLTTTFSEFNNPTNLPFSGAETNDFQFFTTYTPGPVVHTNGVAVVMWQKDYLGHTNQAVTIRTGIYENGIRVSPNPNITNGPNVLITATLTQPTENESEETDE